MGKLIHEELSRTIIGAAMEVLNELKPGLDEKLYERAMAIECSEPVTPLLHKIRIRSSIAAK